MANIKNILLVGVGGQGTVLASTVLSKGLVEQGYDVKMSEVHGMAQRGGSVTTQVRYGDKVYSPIIGKGQADVLVSFEVMEALRWLEYLKPDGVAIINNYRIPSAPILAGKADYPDGILEEIQSKVKTKAIDAIKLAQDLGNEKAMNIVLLGALVKAMELEEINWIKIIESTVKEEYIKLNIDAFNLGLEV